jgi:hypothetical protein
MAKTAVQLVDVALPKSNSGRKGTPINEDFANALITAFGESITTETDGDIRPRALGSPDEFKTKGKASAAGRKYADAVAKKLGKKLRVNVYSAEKDKAPFYWRIYVPLNDDEGNATS